MHRVEQDPLLRIFRGLRFRFRVPAHRQGSPFPGACWLSESPFLGSASRRGVTVSRDLPFPGTCSPLGVTVSGNLLAVGGHRF